MKYFTSEWADSDDESWVSSVGDSYRTSLINIEWANLGDAKAIAYGLDLRGAKYRYLRLVEGNGIALFLEILGNPEGLEVVIVYHSTGDLNFPSSGTIWYDELGYSELRLTHGFLFTDGSEMTITASSVNLYINSRDCFQLPYAANDIGQLKA